jgi:CheY-like chemotaxis protein
MSRRTKGSGNLLIVDDHATNLTLLRAQLEADGHAVFEAHDGVEALALLERLHRVGDPGRLARVTKARGELRQDPRRAIDLAEQHRPTVRRQRAAVKARLHCPPRHGLKRQRPGRTLCFHNGCLRVQG